MKDGIDYGAAYFYGPDAYQGPGEPAPGKDKTCARCGAVNPPGTELCPTPDHRGHRMLHVFRIETNRRNA